MRSVKICCLLNILSIGLNYHPVLELGPLSIGIVQKSESKIRDILQRFPESSQERSIQGHTPLHFAANWPVGLRILLDAGFYTLLNVDDENWKLPVEYAIFLHSSECVNIFIQAGCTLYSSDGRCVLEDTLLRNGSWEISDVLLQHLARNRRRLKELAEERLPPWYTSTA